MAVCLLCILISGYVTKHSIGV